MTAVEVQAFKDEWGQVGYRPIVLNGGSKFYEGERGADRLFDGRHLTPADYVDMRRQLDVHMERTRQFEAGRLPERAEPDPNAPETEWERQARERDAEAARIGEHQRSPEYRSQRTLELLERIAVAVERQGQTR